MYLYFYIKINQIFLLVKKVLVIDSFKLNDRLDIRRHRFLTKYPVFI